MTKTSYQVPAPTPAQLAEYEKSGCSTIAKRVRVATHIGGMVKPVNMTKSQIKAESHRLALKYCLGVD